MNHVSGKTLGPRSPEALTDVASGLAIPLLSIYLYSVNSLAAYLIRLKVYRRRITAWRERERAIASIIYVRA